MVKRSYLLFAVFVFALTSGCGTKEKTSEPFTIAQDKKSASPEAVFTQEVDSAPETQQEILNSREIPVTPEQNSLPYSLPSEIEIQQALKNAGAYSGAVDGIIGPNTKKAIEEFQAKNNLAIDGKVGPKTWEKLKDYLLKAPTEAKEKPVD